MPKIDGRRHRKEKGSENWRTNPQVSSVLTVRYICVTHLNEITCTAFIIDTNR